MAESRFRRAFYKLAPSWLTTGDGELVLYSLALVLDAEAERWRQSMRARFPHRCPSDALPAIGRDRKIIRGRNEPDAAYADRLVQWLDAHRTRGNPFALMRQIRAYCQADVRVRTVDRRGNWYTLDFDGTESALIDQANWDWDGDAVTNWSRFWVIIYPTAAGLPWTVGPVWGAADLWGGTWGASGGHTWGSTATQDDVASIRSIVRQWKPAGTACEWIVIAFDAASFDPTVAAQPTPNPTEWAHHGRQDAGGDEVFARLDTARYWKGPSE